MLIWLLIGCLWLFIHRPFEIWPVLLPFHIERASVIVMLVVWLGSGPSLPRGNRLHWAFACFIAVVAASWLTSPCAAAGDLVLESYLKSAAIYVVLATAVRNEQDLCRVLAGYLGAMALWMAHCLREYYNGSAIWAQGIKRLAPVGHTYDFNDFAGLIVCSLPFAWVLWRQWPTWWRRSLLLGYFGLSGYSIMLTGSRMGFVGGLVAGFLACLSSAKRWRLLALFPVLLAIVWALLPADRQARYFTLYDPESGTASGASASAGNYRLGGFEAALPLFYERPLLGYGPMGFMAVNRWMPHNMYGQLLAELGIAGAAAFAMIFWSVGRNALEGRRIFFLLRAATPGDGRSDEGLPPNLGPLAWNTMVAVAAAYILLAVMGWGFNFLYWHVWLWFGGFQLAALRCLKDEAAFAAESGDWLPGADAEQLGADAERLGTDAERWSAADEF